MPRSLSVFRFLSVAPFIPATKSWVSWRALFFWEGKSSSNLGSWDDRICSVVFSWAPLSGVLPQMFRLIVPGSTSEGLVLQHRTLQATHFWQWKRVKEHGEILWNYQFPANIQTYTNIGHHWAAICKKTVEFSVAKDAMLGACRVRVPVRFRCFTSSRKVVKAARKSRIVDQWDTGAFTMGSWTNCVFMHRRFLRALQGPSFLRTLARFKQVRRARMPKGNPKQFAPFLEQVGESSLWLYMPL